MNLTTEEKKAIRTLKRLAQNWPESLWLFSASASLCIMKTDDCGDRIFLSNGGVDPDYVIDTINIPNDGGDW